MALGLLLHSARVLVRLLAFLSLLLDRVVHVVLLLVLYVKPFEEAVEVEVVQIIRAQGKLGDDEFDVLVFQLQFSEHVDEILAGHCFLPVLYILEGHLQLPGVGTGHFSNANYHFLLLVLLHQLEVVNHLP